MGRGEERREGRRREWGGERRGEEENGEGRRSEWGEERRGEEVSGEARCEWGEK